MVYAQLTPEYDAALAALIRKNLKAHQLDVPGTVYYDEGLDHLSGYYARDGRKYFIALYDGDLVGGIGLAEIDVFPECCELQKLYLDDRVKGRGYGYELIGKVEEEARRLGYKRIYLETHTNLKVAVHTYERAGYKQIGRPESVVHSTMDLFYLKELE